MQNNLQKYPLLLLALLTMLLLAGCGTHKHLHALQAYAASIQTPTAKAQNTDILKGLETPAPVVYQNKNLRSPFVATGLTVGPKQKLKSLTHPLLNFPLSALSFTGTVTQNKTTWAFILTPDKKLYQVKIGDGIGDSYGKIVNITLQTLEVKEPLESPKENGGPVNTRIVTLRLKDINQ